MASTTVTMPQTPPENSPRTNYQSIFDNALHEYKNKTRKDLPSYPLFHKLQSCGSPDDIITTLRQQIPVFDQSASGSSDDRLTRWLDPTVKVINAFSAAIGGAVSLVGPSSRPNLRPDIYAAGIPTRRSYLHGHRHPPLSEYIHRFPLLKLSI
jgi:hypothetical protein